MRAARVAEPREAAGGQQAGGLFHAQPAQRAGKTLARREDPVQAAQGNAERVGHVLARQAGLGQALAQQVGGEPAKARRLWLGAFGRPRDGQAQQHPELVDDQRGRQPRRGGELRRQVLQQAAQRQAPARVARDAPRHAVRADRQPALDPVDRQLHRGAVHALAEVEFIALARIDQHRIPGSQGRAAAALRGAPGPVELANQVVEVVPAAADGRVGAVDVLRAGADPVHRDRPERLVQQAGGEALRPRTCDVHLEKGLADRADPVVQALRAGHGIRAPLAVRDFHARTFGPVWPSGL